MCVVLCVVFSVCVCCVFLMFVLCVVCSGCVLCALYVHVGCSGCVSCVVCSVCVCMLYYKAEYVLKYLLLGF